MSTMIDPRFKAPQVGLHAGSKVATLATIPGREEECRRAVESLLVSMDAVLCVFNYRDQAYPGWAWELEKGHNFTPIKHDNSFGDGAKFAISQELCGYQFICDDDIVYPPTYAQDMAAIVDRYHRRAAVGLGGNISNFYFYSRGPIC